MPYLSYTGYRNLVKYIQDTILGGDTSGEDSLVMGFVQMHIINIVPLSFERTTKKLNRKNGFRSTEPFKQNPNEQVGMNEE